MGHPIRALIVDNSASVRQTLAGILDSDPDIKVIGTAPDPYAAARKIAQEAPDVITLDVEMPRMDGITFLRKLMAQHPIPVVMCSSLTEEGSATLMQALEAGAVDVILKPRVDTKQGLIEAGVRICDAVKAAARANLKRLPERRAPHQPHELAKLSADVMLPGPIPRQAMARTTETVVCMGASTGGTESLRVVLEALPVDCPGIVIVQHMPEKFTAAFAQRLDGLCAIEVEGSRGRRQGSSREGAYRPRQPAYNAPAQRRPVLCLGQGRAAGVAAPAVGRRAVPLGGEIRGQQCDGHSDDRHGRRRRARASSKCTMPGRRRLRRTRRRRWFSGCPGKPSSAARPGRSCRWG